ncbi:MAG: leucine-rich repeat protein, partial [Eubacteriales bacterium]
SLESCKLPDSVEKIDSLYASPTFKRCSKLKEVVLPVGIETIGHSAFYECTALETVRNTEDISKIDSYAFFGCTKLERFQLSDVKIDTNSFWDCKKWANNIGLIIINDAIIDTLDHLPQEIEVPSNVKIVGEEAFHSRTCVHRIVLPDGLIEIGKRAFARCMNLCEINIPSSVKSIGTDAFSYAVSLEKIEIPKTTKVMKAFENCKTVVNRV